MQLGIAVPVASTSFDWTLLSCPDERALVDVLLKSSFTAMHTRRRPTVNHNVNTCHNSLVWSKADQRRTQDNSKSPLVFCGASTGSRVSSENPGRAKQGSTPRCSFIFCFEVLV